MHIPDGYLSPQTYVPLYGVFVAAIAVAVRKIKKEIDALPKGSIKPRRIAGERYYYLQARVGSKVKQKYLGKAIPAQLAKEIDRRKALKAELKRVNESLKIIKRAGGRRR